MFRLHLYKCLDCSSLLSWLELLHNYFQELLWQPLTQIQFDKNECLESSTSIMPIFYFYYGLANFFFTTIKITTATTSSSSNCNIKKIAALTYTCQEEDANYYHFLFFSTTKKIRIFWFWILYYFG